MCISCYIYVMDIIISFLSKQLQPKKFETESILLESCYCLEELHLKSIHL